MWDMRERSLGADRKGGFLVVIAMVEMRLSTVLVGCS